MEIGQAKNVKFVGYSDMEGRGDAVQLMAYGNYLYVGHAFSGGVSILDISDPKNPKVVTYIPCAENTWNTNIQVADDIMLVADEINLFSGDPNQPWSSGLRIFDISNPLKPQELSFLPTAGNGPHRSWYVGGKYAHMSMPLEGYTRNIYVILDISDPRKPTEVSRWWLPGMWEAGGEEPLSRIPPLNGLVGARVDLGKRFMVELYTRWALKQDQLSALDKKDIRIPDGGTPGWITLNVRGWLRVARFLLLRFAVENMLDTKYKTPDHPSSADISQVVTYAEIKGCHDAMLVYPKPLNTPLDEKLGRIRVRALAFSIDGDLEEAGARFAQDLLSCLEEAA